MSAKTRNQNPAREGGAPRPGTAVPGSVRYSARSPKPTEDSLIPYGTQTPRSRWVLGLWIVFCAAWLIFLFTLAVRDRLHP